MDRFIHKITVSILIILPGVFFTCSVIRAQVVQDSVPELMQIDIVEHLGEPLPLSLTFTDDNGNTVKLADYFDHEKPVVLTLGYFECPMLCNLVFNGVSNGIKNLGWTPGGKYDVISVSIDHLETSELAEAKKANYIKLLDMPGSESGWHFLVGDESQSKELAEAVGFKFFYVEETDEYAHPAAVYLISPEGVISRYLYGIQYKANDLKLGLLEASEGKIGSTIDRIVLYCFRYDPDSKGYVLFAKNVMKLGGLVTVVLLIFFVGSLWVRERMNPASPVLGAENNNKESGVKIS